MPNPNPSPETRFKMIGDEPLSKKLSIKLSEEMAARVHKVDGGNFAAWAREAIAEKLAKLEKEKLVV